MKKFLFQGESLRAQAKSLVLDFMLNNPECKPSAVGMRQADIFRSTGLDWGDKEKATSSNQQYWLVALLRELESQGYIEQITDSGPWRIK